MNRGADLINKLPVNRRDFHDHTVLSKTIKGVVKNVFYMKVKVQCFVHAKVLLFNFNFWCEFNFSDV